MGASLTFAQKLVLSEQSESNVCMAASIYN